MIMEVLLLTDVPPSTLGSLSYYVRVQAPNVSGFGLNIHTFEIDFDTRNLTKWVLRYLDPWGRSRFEPL